MTPEMWNTILSAVLFTLIGAVGWMAKSVITTSREVAKHAKDIENLKDLVDTDKLDASINTVHKRVTACSREVAKLAGKLTSIETQTQMINQHLLDKRP